MNRSPRLFAMLLATCLPVAAVATPAVPSPAAEAAPVEEAAPVAEASVAPVAPVAPVAFMPVNCIKVERLRVAQDKAVEGQTDRAADIPSMSIDIILERTLVHLQKKLPRMTVVDAEKGACPDPAATAILRSDLLDFRKGNMALRYLVGFGAGTQKVRVKAALLREPDGSTIAEQEVADAKWGGIIGGTNRKGLDDFAEKAAQFAAKALGDK